MVFPNVVNRWCKPVCRASGKPSRVVRMDPRQSEAGLAVQAIAFPGRGVVTIHPQHKRDRLGLATALALLPPEYSVYGGTCPVAMMTGNIDQTLRCVLGSCSPAATQCSSDLIIGCGYIETCDSSGNFWTMPQPSAEVWNQAQTGSCSGSNNVAVSCSPLPGKCDCPTGYVKLQW